jgi:CBS domain-containing protein
MATCAAPSKRTTIFAAARVGGDDANPSTIAPDARLQEALRLMEDRPSQISVLPVLDPASGVCLGLLRLHDIYRAGIESARR